VEDEGVDAPLLDAVGVCDEGGGLDVDLEVDVDVATSGLSEILAPKSRVEKNFSEELDWYSVDMVLVLVWLSVVSVCST
jgi:hypothetical protein